MRKIITASIAALALAGAIPAQAESAGTSCKAAAEDSGNWNWAKCGNRQRGVILLDGSTRVVGPCGFNRLWSAGAIRYDRGAGDFYDGLMKPLRGDRFARSLTDCPWRIRQGRPFPQHAEGIY